MNRKKLLSLLLSVAMVASLAVPTMAAQEIQPRTAGKEDVTILYTNDVHTYIDNTRKVGEGDAETTVPGLRYSTIAGYKEEVGADFLVDAGDHIQGTPYGKYDEGETIIKLMNAVGYTASTLGNHEFDYNMTRTLELVGMAEYDYVSCNIYNTETKAQLLDSYKVYEAANGKKVAFVGFTTPESITKSTPKYFMNDKGELVWAFSDNNAGAELYATAQKAIDAAAKEADYVIGVGHMGVDEGSAPYTSEDVIANTTGLTAFIDGHSHTTMEMKEVKDKAGKAIVLTQTGCYLAALGEMTISANGAVTTKLLSAEDLADVTPNADVAKIEDEFIKKVDDELSAVIGATEVEMSTNNAEGKRIVRKEESTIANFCADAMYWYFENAGYDVDVAVVQGGGVRAGLSGQITAKDMQKIFPWGNALSLKEVTGQQLLDALEHGVRNANVENTEENGGFLNVSGARFKLNAGIPSTVQYDEGTGLWEGAPTGAYRVTDLEIKNRTTGEYEPIDLTKNYLVGSTTYIMDNDGDGMTMFREGTIKGQDLAIDFEALADYVKTFPVDAKTNLPTIKAGMGYDAPEGRIVLINEPASHEPVIKTPDEVAGMKAGTMTGKTVILHTNDVHGAVEGYAYIAALRDTYKKAGAEVILADAGDFSQGTTYVSIQKGADAVTLMNAAGYDLATLGNHEFDYGYDKLMENLSKASFKTLCADVLKDGKTILDPTYVYTTKSGLKLGFFGLETPETQTKVNPGLIKGVTFLSNSAGKTELYECGQAQVDALKKAGADLIIGLVHLGVDDESAGDGHRSVDLLANTKGIDMLIDGHSHTVMTSGANGEPIQSTGTKFANIGVVVIDNKTKTIEDNYLVATKVMGKDKDDKDIVVSELPQDKTVADAAKKITERVDSEYGAVFAKSEVELCGVNNPGNRTMETNNGNLITDAMMWNVLKEGGLTVPEEYAVTITNGGGIRAPIKAGDITMKDINTDLPFGNTLAVVYVTGSELLEALEASTFATPGAIGGFPQTAGMKWTVNTGIKYDANADTYPGSTYYGPASIQRVTIQSINGKDFDPNATYAVITNNFCAAGGDTYYAFKRAYDAGTGFDTGIVLDAAVVSYITEELKGVISAEKYGGPQGRLTIVNRPADLDEKEWWYDAAIEALDTGLMQGTDKGFDALAEITEATVYQTLYNAAGNTDKAAEGEEWYAPALAWAAEQGLYKAEGEFKDGVINREKTLAILTAYAPNAEGLMVGNEKGDMMAQKALTRAELAQVMVRLAGVPTPLAD